jgi:hypothetical protein
MEKTRLEDTGVCGQVRHSAQQRSTGSAPVCALLAYPLREGAAGRGAKGEISVIKTAHTAVDGILSLRAGKFGAKLSSMCMLGNE